jgi:hypothetical protein
VKMLILLRQWCDSITFQKLAAREEIVWLVKDMCWLIWTSSDCGLEVGVPFWHLRHYYVIAWLASEKLQKKQIQTIKTS